MIHIPDMTDAAGALPAQPQPQTDWRVHSSAEVTLGRKRLSWPISR